MNVEAAEKTYTVRDLRNGDQRRVVRAMKKISDNEFFMNSILQAQSAEEDNMALAATGFIKAFIDDAPEELDLLAAHFVGITGEPFADARKRDDERAQEAAEAQRVAAISNGQVQPVHWRTFRKSDDELRSELDEGILAEMDSLSPGATLQIISEVMEREDFEPFLEGCLRLYQAGRGLSGIWQKMSRKSSGSKTKKS